MGERGWRKALDEATGHFVGLAFAVALFAATSGALLSALALGTALWLLLKKQRPQANRRGAPSLLDVLRRSMWLGQLLGGWLVLVPLCGVAFRILVGGTYYVRPLVGVAVLAMVVATAALHEVLRRPVTGLAVWGWLAVTFVASATTATLLLAINPSPDGVRSAMDQGRLEAAWAELEALGEPHRSDREELELLRLELVMLEGLRTSSCAAATPALAELAAEAAEAPHPRGTSHREAMRARLAAHADQLAEAAAQEELAHGRIEQARAAMACGSATLRAGAVGQEVALQSELAAAELCLAQQRWSCVPPITAEVTEVRELRGSAAAQARASALRTATISAARREIEAALAKAKADTAPRSRLQSQRLAIDLWKRYLLAGQGEAPRQLTELEAQAEQTRQALDAEQR
jgi:hypothetical protein